MKMIVGLGNPGKKYQLTRHNVGFIIIDRIFDDIKWQKKFNGLYNVANFAEEKVLIIKPQTYMNLSGNSVRKFAAYYNIAPTDILVIHDDLDLPFLSIRIKKDSSDGGHNGIKSIHECLGTFAFCRLKIGIKNETDKDAKEYVLDTFSKKEVEILISKTDTFKSIIESFVTKDIEWVMNQYNHK